MAAEDLEGDRVFHSSVELLPHHEDQPFLQSMHHEAHRERHRNTRDYVAHAHSPQTNRKNAGILLRRMSDDFNMRKFPEVVEAVKGRRRAMSEGAVNPITTDGGDSGTTKVYRLVRRLSSTAIGPTNSARTPVAPAQPLLESTEEDNTE